MNGAVAAIVSESMASWLPRTWCIRGAELGVRVDELFVLLVGTSVGEITFHQHGIGIERLDLGDRPRVHHTRVRRFTRFRVQDRTELLGSPEPATFPLAEVHVVDGGQRGELLARRTRQRRDARRKQIRRVDAVDREGVLGLRFQAGDLRRVERTGRGHRVIAHRRRHGGRLIGSERHHDLVGPDGEELRVLDH